MRKLLALVLKDLHESSIALTGLVVLHAIVAIFASLHLQDAGADHRDVILYARVLPIVSTAVFSHRLLSAELTDRTWLFLGTLPLGKPLLLGTKVLLGLALVCGLQLILAGSSALGLAERYALGSTDILRHITHYLSYATCMWGAGVGLALVGRYRIPLILAVVATTISMGTIEFKKTPFPLLPNSLAPDSPYRAWGAVMAASWFGVGTAFAGTLLAVRNGSIADLVAQRMSYREKVTMSACLIALVVGMIFYDEHQPKEPFELTGAVVREEDGVSLRLRPPASMSEAEVDQLADDLHAGLAGLLGRISHGPLPPVFVTHRSSLDATAHERGFARDKDGILLRTNLDAPDWLASDFQAWAVGLVLREATGQAATREDRRWAFDGLRSWWSLRNDELTSEKLILRTCYGAPDGLTRAQLDGWYTHREELGPHIAAAVGGDLLVTVEERFGPDVLDRFLRATVATQASHSFLGSLEERGTPVAERFEAATGETLDAFLAAWSERQVARCAERADVLARLPRLDGRSEVEGGRAGRRVRVKLEGNLPDDARVRLQSSRDRFPFHPFDTGDKLDMVDLDAEEARQGWALERSWPVGAMAVWRLSTVDPTLGCEVGTGWRRELVP